MFPFDPIDDSIGRFSERVFRSTLSGGAGSDRSAADAAEQKFLMAVDDGHGQVDRKELERALRIGLVERTATGIELTALGRYALSGQRPAQQTMGA